MPPARAAHVAEQVADALVEAHGMGVIHRDIKPANVMLANRGGIYDQTKVVDFGLVKRLDTDLDTHVSRQGTIVGTPLYLAPEVIRGEGEDGVGRDLYALGCMIYYLLTGEDVFKGATPIQVCMQHLESEPEPPSTRLKRPIPEGLEALVLDLLAKSPEARPGSALEVLERLEHLPTHDEWTRNDAKAWWQGPGRTLRERAPAKRSGRQVSLTIDMQNRTPRGSVRNAHAS